MKKQRIPLVGSSFNRSYNVDQLGQGGYDEARDQRFVNCMWRIPRNAVTSKSKLMCDKRPGYAEVSVTGGSISGNGYSCIYWNAIDNLVASFDSDGKIVVGTAYTETMSGYTRRITETVSGGESVLMFAQSDSTGWYLAYGAGTTGGTFTATTTSGNADLTVVSSTTGLYVGQALSGTGIQAGARISAISGSTVTMTLTATANGAGVTITRSSIAKLISANYPGNASKTTVGGFACLYGYAFIMDTTGTIWNCDRNAVATWQSTSWIQQQAKAGDVGVSLAMHKNYVVAFNKGSTEFLYNAGNASGSPLERVPQMAMRIGLQQGASTAFKQFCYLNDNIYFAGISDMGLCSIYEMSGGNAKKISTEFIDEALSVSPTLVFVSSLSTLGKNFILVYTQPIDSGAATYSITWAYDVDLQIWCQWKFADGAAVIAEVANNSVNPNNVVVRGVGLMSNTAKLFSWNGKTPFVKDAGTAFDRVIQLDGNDFGTGSFKTFHETRIVGDQMTATWPMSVSFLDDNRSTYSTARTIDMVSPNKKIVACGGARERTIRITDSNSGFCNLEALEVVYEEGAV